MRLKIVNADNTNVDPASVPGFIQVRLKRSPGSVFCGGVKISDNAVLTAAHCVYQRRPRDLVVLMNLSKTSPGGFNRFTTTVVNIDTIHVHPRYNPRTLRNDIAIIFFRPTSQTSRQSITQFCPEELLKTYLKKDQPVRIFGYGTVSSGGPVSSTLRSADIKIMDIQQTKYPSSYKTPDNFLAGDEEDPTDPFDNQDTCQGDSGGPLFSHHPHQVQPYLLGLTSWGTGCASDGYPGFYTNVGYFRTWIQDHLKTKSR